MKTILLDSVDLAQKAYDVLSAMIDVDYDNCNAITFDWSDREAVDWLVREKYCFAHASCLRSLTSKDKQQLRDLVGSELVEIKSQLPDFIAEKVEGDIRKARSYQWQNWLIVEINTNCDSYYFALDENQRIAQSLWWGYEDGFMDVVEYVLAYLYDDAIAFCLSK